MYFLPWLVQGSITSFRSNWTWPDLKSFRFQKLAVLVNKISTTLNLQAFSYYGLNHSTKFMILNRFNFFVTNVLSSFPAILKNVCSSKMRFWIKMKPLHHTIMHVIYYILMKVLSYWTVIGKLVTTLKHPETSCKNYLLHDAEQHVFEICTWKQHMVNQLTCRNFCWVL